MWKATCISFDECTQRQADRVQHHLNAIKIKFTSSSHRRLFFVVVLNIFRLISICSDRAYYFIFFLNRISFCFVFEFVVHFFFFVVVAVIFLHAVLILLCHFFGGSFHQLTALWLYFMNNAINCESHNLWFPEWKQQQAAEASLAAFETEIFLMYTFTWLCGVTLFLCVCCVWMFTLKSNTHSKGVMWLLIET